ncbi:TPA: ABC transporter permease [Candidatus Poribacteria bacterium]|nr:ABC transporter permease [Candidatus Poribacteria bacterium]
MNRSISSIFNESQFKSFVVALYRRWSRYLGIILSLVLISAIFSLLTPIYLTGQNLINIAQQAVINSIVALGMTVVIISGGIDLSVGSIVALTSLIVAQNMAEKSIPSALLIGIAVGIICGLINGGLISYLKLQPFLVTLGTMSLYRGLALIFCNGLPIRNIPSAFLVGMNALNNSFPIPVIIMFAFSLLIGFLMRKTVIGEYIFAIGGNEEATRLSGIRVNEIKVLGYVISAIACTIAGIIFISRLGVADPQAGIGYELEAIAAAAVGGASLSGGKGSILGTIIGALLLSAIRNGLTLLNVQAFYQYVAVGIIIIIAISIDRFSRKA